MTKVSIKNYQSIKDCSFEISGFTVIFGKNNIGKSAVIRAIEAPIANQVGKDFIRQGEKKTTVNIIRDDIDIKWVKGNTATYTIDKRDGSKIETYSKLNRDVPKPLLEAGYGKIEIGDKKVFPFIAPQFEERFLVDKPGSVVTEVLATLYDIDILSKADELCQKAIKSQKHMLKTREADLKSTQDKLKDFADFEDIKATVNELTLKEGDAKNLDTEIFTLNEYEEKTRQLTESLSSLRHITQVVIPTYDEFEELLEKLQWIREKEEGYQRLTGNVEKLKDIPKLKIPKTKKTETLAKEVKRLCDWDDALIELIKKIKQQKEFLENFDMAKITDTAKKIEEATQEFNGIKNLEESFSKAVMTTKALRDEFNIVKKNLEEQEQEMSKIKICPLCQRPL